MVMRRRLLASGLLWSLVGVFAVLVVLFVVGSPWAGAQVNNEPTGVPTVGGTVRVGEKLTVDVSGIADTDGLNNADFQYQWYANDGTYQVGTDGLFVDGSVHPTLVIPAWTEGKTLWVNVEFTDDAGNDEAVHSVETVTVAPLSVLEDDTASTDTRFTDTTVAAETTYVYAVAGINTGAESVAATVTTPAEPAEPSDSASTLVWRDGDRIIPVQIITTPPQDGDGGVAPRGDGGQPGVARVSVAGNVLELPGGVLVMLDGSWTPAQTKAFFAANNIAKSRVSPRASRTTRSWCTPRPAWPA